MTTPPPFKRTVPAGRTRFGAAVVALLRARLTTGVLTILPVIITLWVLQFVFVLMRDASRWAVEAFLLSPTGRPYLEALRFDFARWQRLGELGLTSRHEQFFEFMPGPVQWGVGLFSVALTLCVLYLVGFFAAHVFGRRIIAFFEQFFENLPLVKTIYKAMKQILSSFSSEQSQSFQRVALVPFPSDTLRSVAFITNTFKDSVSGEELCCVFIITTPNPTTGYLQVVRRSAITEVDWSVEEAFRVVMSAGILTPPNVTMALNVQRSAAVDVKKATRRQ